MSKEVKKEEAIAEGLFRISNLWKEEDWLAIWIGFIVIAIGSISVLTGAFDFSALKFSPGEMARACWSSLHRHLEQSSC